MRKELTTANLSNIIQKFLKITLNDRDTFNLFSFLCLNFSFAIIELFYGIMTNSLGLISDSFHMFFDCSALVTGLVASIISKWPRNASYTFGYGRAEILAGLINALILVFISFFIFKEAIERIFDQPHIHHHRLFLVSVLGFLVNLVGIFVFHHGHSSDSPCCHGGEHSHGHKNKHNHKEKHAHDHCVSDCHDHLESDCHDHAHLFTEKENSSSSVAVLIPQVGEVDKCCHHEHSENQTTFDQVKPHKHKHGNHSESKIIQGVFLHIMADTLGSVGVIISSFLITKYNMMISDTICSIFCSVLIFISALPLLKESIDILMERVPPHIESKIFTSLDRIRKLPGIYGIPNYHVWTLCTDTYCSTLTIIIAPTVDPLILTENVNKIIKETGVTEIYIQMERAY